MMRNPKDFETFDSFMGVLLDDFAIGVMKGACWGCGNCDGTPCPPEYEALEKDAKAWWAKRDMDE